MDPREKLKKMWQDHQGINDPTKKAKHRIAIRDYAKKHNLNLSEQQEDFGIPALLAGAAIKSVGKDLLSSDGAGDKGMVNIGDMVLVPSKGIRGKVKTIKRKEEGGEVEYVEVESPSGKLLKLAYADIQLEGPKRKIDTVHSETDFDAADMKRTIEYQKKKAEAEKKGLIYGKGKHMSEDEEFAKLPKMKPLSKIEISLPKKYPEKNVKIKFKSDKGPIASITGIYFYEGNSEIGAITSLHGAGDDKNPKGKYAYIKDLWKKVEGKFPQVKSIINDSKLVKDITNFISDELNKNQFSEQSENFSEGNSIIDNKLEFLGINSTKSQEFAEDEKDLSKFKFLGINI